MATRERREPARLADDATWGSGPAGAWRSEPLRSRRPSAAKSAKPKCSPARRQALERARAVRAEMAAARKKAATKATKSVKPKCSPARRRALERARAVRAEMAAARKKAAKGGKPLGTIVVVADPPSRYGSPEMEARITDAAESRLREMIECYTRMVAGVAEGVTPNDYAHLSEATAYVAHLAQRLASDDLDAKVKAARAAPPDWMVLLAMA